MTKTEIARLAAAIAILRPDWPEPSLRTFLETNLARRPLHDSAVALTWIATDPDTQKPGRVLEAGPWWNTIRQTAPPIRPRNHCPDHPDHPLRDGHCAGCWADKHATSQPLPPRIEGVKPTEQQRQRIHQGLHRPPPVESRHPSGGAG